MVADRHRRRADRSVRLAHPTADGDRIEGHGGANDDRSSPDDSSEGHFSAGSRASSVGERGARNEGSSGWGGSRDRSGAIQRSRGDRGANDGRGDDGCSDNCRVDDGTHGHHHGRRGRQRDLATDDERHW